MEKGPLGEKNVYMDIEKKGKLLLEGWKQQVNNVNNIMIEKA